MQNKAVVLASNVTGASTTVSNVEWQGGRGVVIIQATNYPSTCALQVQAPGTVNTFINVGSYTANTMSSYDLPAGTYRLNMSGGTNCALYATLASVPYG